MRKLLLILLLSVTAPCFAADASDYFYPDNAFSSMQSTSAGLDSDFLPASRAFKVETISVTPDAVNLKFTPAAGYYFYRTKFAFNGTSAVQIGQIDYPQGIVKDDPTYGKTEVYETPTVLSIPYKNSNAESFLLNVGYQGCAEAGLCYPREGIELAIKGIAPNQSSPVSVSTASGEPVQVSTDTTANANEPSGVLLGLLLFFLAGIGLAFTPCVLPMIPIMSAVVLRNAEGRARSFILSSSYVIGMAVSFTVIGALMGVFGAELNFQARVQSPWIIVPFSLIFIALGIALFKSLSLQMPSVITSGLNKLSAGIKGGSVMGSMAIGAVSALITSPCVSAPLAGALLYIGQTGDVWRGAANLMMLALGMGLPLIVFAVGGGWLIPKAGQWMNTVKNVFAAGLVVFGLWFMGRVIPDHLMMTVWATLSTYGAYSLGALDRKSSTEWGRAKQTAGMIMLIFAVTVFFNTFEKFVNPVGSSHDLISPKSAWIETTNYSEVLSTLEAAKQQGKPAILDWYADWCTSCKIFENEVLKAPDVIAALGGYTLIKYDITASDAGQRQALAKYGLYGPPATLIYGADGKEIVSHRVVGEVGKADFLKRLGDIR